MNSAGGGYTIKRNLWTFLGGEPFFVSGGAVVSYALLSGKTGAALKARVMPIHGGHVRASLVQARVNSYLPDVQRKALEPPET